MSTPPPPLDLPVGEVSAAVYVSPHPATPELDPEPAVAALIEHAQAEILVAVYSFTLPDLAHALIERHTAGVSVRVLTDTGEARGVTSQIPALVAAGVPVRTWGGPWKLMHDKWLLVDSTAAAVGSWNWTEQAEKSNVEALLVVRGSRVRSVLAPVLRAQFVAAWPVGERLR